jgi:hypothetical protein
VIITKREQIVGELRFLVLVRREGQSVHDSDKFATEEYRDIDQLKEAVNHYIDIQFEDEDINGNDRDDMWDEVSDEN